MISGSFEIGLQIEYSEKFKEFSIQVLLELSHGIYLSNNNFSSIPKNNLSGGIQTFLQKTKNRSNHFKQFGSFSSLGSCNFEVFELCKPLSKKPFQNRSNIVTGKEKFLIKQNADLKSENEDLKNENFKYVEYEKKS